MQIKGMDAMGWEMLVKDTFYIPMIDVLRKMAGPAVLL